MRARRLSRGFHLAGFAAVVAALVLAPVAASPTPRTVNVKPVRAGGLGFGSRSRPSFSRPVTGFGRRTPGRSRQILRRIGHALAFAAILHFLFAGTYGGGFLFLLLLIGLLAVVMRRRRRRVYARW